MIKNYFRVALRNILNNKVFSAINISGLAVGLTCSLLIFLWVQDEYSVDAFHKNKSRLYYIYERNFSLGKTEASYKTRGLLAEELKTNMAAIEYSVAVESAGSVVCKAENKIVKMGGIFAGYDFFSMFTYPLLQGSQNTVLNETVGIVISRKMAEAFFGTTEKAIGNTIRYADKEDLAITGVFENLPANSSLQFDFIRPYQAFLNQNEWAKTWGSSNPLSIVQLRRDADPEKVEADIKNFLTRYMPDASSRIELGLQPYHKRYLHEKFTNGRPDGGRVEYVRLFSIVAIIILLIACINFMNLSTARSSKRSKEVGVRKVLGANRFRLITQFSREAFLLTFFATVVAMALAALALPSFNVLSGKQLDIPVGQPFFWLSLLCLMILTSLVAGSYPSFFLSSLRPIQVLKSKMKFSRGAIVFRRSLVVIQFAFSMIFMVSMIVIYRQLNYVETKNLGFNRDNLIYIPIEGELAENYGLFKQRTANVPGIMAVSRMRQTPTGYHHYKGDISWPGKSRDSQEQIADVIVGYDFVNTLQLQLKEGRDFSEAYGTDSTNFLVNESMAARMGYRELVGKPLSWDRKKG